MPRKRMIHPEFFTSATLARVDPRTMVTFAGLWIYCDDYGRGEDDPAFVASAVWPRRTDVGPPEVEADLKVLGASGTVCRYTVGGVPLLHVPSWLEHQRVSHPTPSKLPPCPSCEGALFKEWWRDDDTATDRFRRAEKALRAARTAAESSSGTAPETLPKDSGTTPSQSSSVEVSSVKGARREFRRRAA